MPAKIVESRPVVAKAADDGRFATLINLPGGPILADEPASVGGGGAGPTPYQLLSAALAACTSMTLRVYGRTKKVDLPPFRVEVEHSLVPGDPPIDRFTRRILFDAPLDRAERSRFIAVAARCPVHRTLGGGGARIVTSAEAPVPPSLAPLAPVDPPSAHVEQMTACVDCPEPDPSAFKSGS